MFSEWTLYERQISADTDSKQSIQLQASSFETALYQLDTLINDSLLRLLLESFDELQDNPIVKLRTHFQKNADKATINEAIEKFDEITDRLLQIGMFGVAFSSDYRSGLNCTKYKI